MTDTRDRTIHRLRSAGCVFAEEEADLLLSAADTEALLDTLVEKRVAGAPLEQVLGWADFAGVRVRLRPGVFVPRVRSELLVRTAVAAAPAVVVDLCCGSGALGLAVRHRRGGDVELYASDADPAAVACARDNLGDDLVFLGDLFDPLPEHLRGRVDVLLANVPYVATRHLGLLPAEARLHESPAALDGGDDGLDVFRLVAGGAPAWLGDGGVLLSEITEAQEEAAVAAVEAAGLTASLHHDDDLEATVIEGRRHRRHTNVR